MAGYNRITLVGYLTRDPELTTSSGGVPFTRTGIAVNRFKPRAAPEAEKADFFNLVAFRHTAELLAKHCAKGSRLLIEGPLQFSTYQASEQEKPRTSHSVIVNKLLFLSKPAQTTPATPAPRPGPRTPARDLFAPPPSRPRRGSSKPAAEVDDEDE